MSIKKSTLITAAIVLTGVVVAGYTLTKTKTPKIETVQTVSNQSQAVQTETLQSETLQSETDQSELGQAGYNTSSAPQKAPATTASVATADMQKDTAGPLSSMAEQLAKRLEIQPNDVDGWILLGRTYQYMGNDGAATEAYKKAEQLGYDSEKLAQIRSSMAADRQKAKPELLLPEKQASKNMTAVMIDQAISNADKKTAKAFTITGEVSLAPELEKYLQQGDTTLYIFAKPEQGPPMPLAVVRQSNAQLPVKFTLDDSNAIMPDNKLSNSSSVIVGARISFSGNASAESGDLEGFSGVIKSNENKPVSININKIRQ